MADLTSITGAALFDGTFSERREVASRAVLLEFMVESPAEALLPSPGQFYQVRCGHGREHVLRRPLSANGADEVSGGLRLRFLVDRVGWGTERLSRLEPGERVSMLGPLGRGFQLVGVRKALLVAGGIGVAPLMFLARKLEAAGIEYDFLAGFNTGCERCDGLDELETRVVTFTEDGSLGTRGRACDSLEKYLRRGGCAAFVCGPEAMMKVAAEICEKAGVSCQVSLDARMACGIGACRACVKEGVGGRNLCVCSEGPVFDSREVSWKKCNTGSDPGVAKPVPGPH